MLGPFWRGWGIWTPRAGHESTRSLTFAPPPVSGVDWRLQATLDSLSLFATISATDSLRYWLLDALVLQLQLIGRAEVHIAVPAFALARGAEGRLAVGGVLAREGELA